VDPAAQRKAEKRAGVEAAANCFEAIAREWMARQTGAEVARRLFEGNNILQRASLDGEKKLPLPIKIDDNLFKSLYRQEVPISAFWTPDTDYSEQRDAIDYVATKAYLAAQMAALGLACIQCLF
jgi:hypothetical protein